MEESVRKAGNAVYRYGSALETSETSIANHGQQKATEDQFMVNS